MPGRRQSRPRGRRAATLVRTLLLLVALAVGAFAGYVDLMSPTAGPALAVVAAGGLVLAFIRPANAWLYAVVIGGAVPIAHLAAPYLGVVEAHVPRPNVAITVLAVAPALAGALLGMLLHRGLFGAGARGSVRARW